MDLPARSSHFLHLKEKWDNHRKHIISGLWEKHGKSLSKIAEKSKQFAVGGSLAGLSLITPAASVIMPQQSPPSLLASEDIGRALDKKTFLVYDLSHILPNKVKELTLPQEYTTAETLTRHFGIPITAELNGIRLNRTYGYIGAEQHLMRYPGDTMETHFDNPEDSQKYYSSGMAPGRGAWGYFAGPNGLDQKAIDREKYYIAVQTFLAPGWREHTAEYVKFFKHRKMLVVNPQNGKAMVVVIGDAGPAEWTGKSLGGSPEVMKYLERVDGRQTGPVLYFFIDDPDDTIPLGPIEAV